VAWYSGDGHVLINNSVISSPSPGPWPGAASQENIVCVDIGNKLLWVFNVTSFIWNGSGTADPSTGVGGYSTSTMGAGAIYAFVSVRANQSPASLGAITADFTGAGFPVTIPAGFSVWN
jgi:hypothetical protein